MDLGTQDLALNLLIRHIFLKLTTSETGNLAYGSPLEK